MRAVGPCGKREIGEEKGIYVTNLSIKMKSIVFVHSSIHHDFWNNLLSHHTVCLISFIKEEIKQK